MREVIQMLMNRSEIIGREIRAGQSRMRLRQADIAVKLRMSLATYNRRLNKPERFTLENLLKLEKVLKIELLNPELKN